MKVSTTILTLILATATAMASIDPQDLTVQRDVTSGTMIVRTTVALEHAAKIVLLDAFNNEVYSDSVQRGAFINKRFPLKSFPLSSYRLIITDNYGKTEQPLSMKSRGAIAKASSASRLVYPRVDLRAERTLVLDYANATGRKVNVRIANQAGETVFSDQVSGEDVQKSYDLDALASGDYEVIVSARDVKEYTTSFALR